jgi:hypothetical protein
MLRLWYACPRVAVVSEERKEEAVRQVAGSVTFHRADVLKALLEYLHVQESLGRAHEVTESEIALKVMGRGSTFSPESDSSVRTRFLALRKKLEEYYAREGSDAEVRLDIPRGTYTLRFVPNIVPQSPQQQQPDSPPTVVVDPATLAQTTMLPAAAPLSRKQFLLGVVAGMATLAAGAGIWTTLAPKPEARETALLTKAWGSMLERGSNVTIAIGTPASFFVRDFGNAEPPVGDPSYRLPFHRDAMFEDWYTRTRNAPLGKTAIFHPNAHSPLWGDAAAASVLSRMFGSHGVLVEQVPSARVHPVGLRDRNSIIIGRPEYTDATRSLVPEEGLAVEYSAKDRLVGVHNRKPKQGEQEWWFATGGLRHNHGLITVLSADAGARKRIVLFSGINSDGAEAGARFFTTPGKLEDLERRFKQAGLSQWPPRYQVVVRTESVDTYSLQVEFEFLRILN